MRKILMCFIVLLFGLATSAGAATISFNLDFEFSGGTPPAGTAPWVTATFTDQATGTVRLTMSTANLVGKEFVSGWYFNLDPDLNPGNLVFTNVDISDSVPNGIGVGVNAFKADGDGYFDILFDFPPPPGKFANKFTTGETVTYDITMAGLTASSFDFSSVQGGGNGTYGSAAHVQGIGTEGQYSGWIGDGGGGNNVPEPGTLLLLGSGLIGLAGWSRKRFET